MISTRWMMLTVGCGLLHGPALAQNVPHVTLMGEVRDFASERPIPDIAVKIVELARVQVTDGNGFFAFDSLPQGRWTFEASGLGYETNREASEVKPRSILLIRLEKDPVQLQGLHVTVTQGLARRRMAAPSRVVPWDRAELDRVISSDIGSFIRREGVAEWTTCGGEFSANDLPNCFIYRGLPVRLQVFVDDEPVPIAEGTSRLWAYDARDLWSVEFLRDCGQLRIYTGMFMEAVESGRVRLAPLYSNC